MNIEDLDDVEDAVDVPDLNDVPSWMSAREWIELRALCFMTNNGARPSMIQWPLHRKFYDRLRRHQFVLATYPHPEVGGRFAAVTPTEKAIKLVEALE